MPRLFSPEPTVRVDRPGRGGGFANGASIWFDLPEEPAGRVELVISPDGSDRVLRRFVSMPEGEEIAGADEERPRIESFEAREGLNRVVWNLRGQAPHLVEGAIMSLSYTGGPYLPPGTYRATLTVAGGTRRTPTSPAATPDDASGGSGSEDPRTRTEGDGEPEAEDWVDSRSFEVLADPRLDDITQADLEEQYAMLDRLSARLTATPRRDRRPAQRPRAGRNARGPARRRRRLGTAARRRGGAGARQRARRTPDRVAQPGSPRTR